MMTMMMIKGYEKGLERVDNGDDAAAAAAAANKKKEHQNIISEKRILCELLSPLIYTYQKRDPRDLIF